MTLLDADVMVVRSQSTTWSTPATAPMTIVQSVHAAIVLAALGRLASWLVSAAYSGEHLNLCGSTPSPATLSYRPTAAPLAVAALVFAAQVP